MRYPLLVDKLDSVMLFVKIGVETLVWRIGFVGKV